MGGNSLYAVDKMFQGNLPLSQHSRCLHPSGRDIGKRAEDCVKCYNCSRIILLSYQHYAA